MKIGTMYPFSFVWVSRMGDPRRAQLASTVGVIRDRIHMKLNHYLSMAISGLLLFLSGNIFAIDAQAKIERFALIVGANDGGSGRTRLAYATSDAKLLSEVMIELGGLAPERKILLLNPDDAELDKSFEHMRRLISASQKRSAKTELLMYYSGHSDEEGFLLKSKKYLYKTVRSKLSSIGADVLIAILDSCSSGAFTRIKGGTRASPFLLEPEGEKIKGHAILTSSSANEAAQESDTIKGSFFTHFLITGLRGGADLRNDGFVSLNEVYQFAYQETLARTQLTQVGSQHPAYDIQMTGSGDIILTDIRLTKSELVFSEPLEGRIYIRDERNNLIAELNKIAGQSTSLGLSAGQYNVTLKKGALLGASDITLPEGKNVTIASDTLKYQQSEITVPRGTATESMLSMPNQSATPLSSENPPAPDKIISTPFHFSVIPGFGSYRLIERNTSANVSINVLGGHIAAVYGFEMGTLFNIVDRDISGLDLAGLFSLNHGTLTGAQISGLLNVSKQGMRGLQLSLMANIAEKESTGAQIGLLNKSEDLTGAQIGLLNMSKKVNGAMIGLVNVADEVAGAPIGLVNVIKGGESHFMTWMSDTERLLNLGYSSGTKTFHTLFGISYVIGNNEINVNESLTDLVLANDTMFIPSLGVGWKNSLQKEYFVNVDTTFGKIFKSTQTITNDVALGTVNSFGEPDFAEEDIILPSGHEYLQKFIFSLGKEFSKNVAVSFGLSLNTYFLLSTEYSLHSLYAPVSFLQEKRILSIENDSFLMTTWPGFQLAFYFL